MPLDVDFYLPFSTPPINPELPEALQRHMAWARRWGLIHDDAGAQRYLFSTAPEFSAHVLPHATGPDLDVAIDVSGYFFLFDDSFDPPPGVFPHDAVSACEQIVAYLVCEPHLLPPGTAPLVAAWADIWVRMTESMSPAWRARSATYWIAYFHANLTEASARACGIDLNTDQYLQVRRQSIGATPTFVMMERAARIKVPTLAFFNPVLETMRALAVDALVMSNDIYSLEKDEARGDANLVRCVMRDRNWSRDKAIDWVRQETDSKVMALAELDSEVPALCEALLLSDRDREAVYGYIELIHNLIQSNARWSVTGGRYSKTAIRQVTDSQAGLLHDQQITQECTTARQPRTR